MKFDQCDPFLAVYGLCCSCWPHSSQFQIADSASDLKML